MTTEFKFCRYWLLALLVILVAGCATSQSVDNNADSTQDKAAESEPAQAEKPALPSDIKTVSINEIKALMEKKDYVRAEAMLRLLVLKEPENAIAWANLGIVLNESSNRDGAENALLKSLQIDPGLAAAYTRLASIYREQGKIKQALEMNNKALEVFPGYANAHYNIAILYDLYMQNPEKALSHLNKYLKLTNSKNKRDLGWKKQLERSVDSAIKKNADKPATTGNAKVANN